MTTPPPDDARGGDAAAAGADAASGAAYERPDAEWPPEHEVPPAAQTDVERRAGGVRWGRFVAGMLVAAAVLVLAVAAFDLLTDPWGVFGVGIFPPRVNQDRSTKADLIAELQQPPRAADLRVVPRLDRRGGAGGAGHRPADLQRRRHRRPAVRRLRVHARGARPLAAGHARLPVAARRGGVPARHAAAVAARRLAVQPLPALAGQGGGPARRARLAGLVERAAAVLRGVEEAPDARQGARELAQAHLGRRHGQDGRRRARPRRAPRR